MNRSNRFKALSFPVLAFLMLLSAAGCDLVKKNHEPTPTPPLSSYTNPPPSWPPGSMPVGSANPAVNRTYFSKPTPVQVIDVGKPGAMTVKVNPTAIAGQYFFMQLPVFGGRPPYTWERIEGSLPPGLSLNAGRISGVPSESGHYSFTFIVKDFEGNEASQNVRITAAAVKPRPTSGGEGGPMFVSSTAAPLVVFEQPKPEVTVAALMTEAEWGSDYIALVPYVQGANPPLTFRIVGLRKELAYDTVTGLIQGQMGSVWDPEKVDIFLRDADGKEARTSFTIQPRKTSGPTPKRPGGGGGGSSGGGGGTGTSTRGTLSASDSANNDIYVSGVGFVGRGRAVVTLNPGTYTVWGTNPSTGQRAWQTSTQIIAGKTSILKR